jgi:hypothetical protein
MRDGVAVVLLCVLVAGAGCSALPGSGGGSELTAANETPGIEDGTVTNSTLLLDAHVAAVIESGFAQTLSVNFTSARQGETYRVSQRQRTRVAAGATEYRYQTITNAQVSSRVVAWGNDSVEYRRGETGGGSPQYQRADPQPPETLAGEKVLAPRLSSEFEVVAVETRADGPDVVTLELTGLPESNDLFKDQEQVENFREFEATLVVDTDGRIHSYDATAVYDVEGERGEYEYTFRMAGFGDPGVERPDWVDEAAS